VKSWKSRTMLGSKVDVNKIYCWLLMVQLPKAHLSATSYVPFHFQDPKLSLWRLLEGC
jgi:hypothetical protein